MKGLNGIAAEDLSVSEKTALDEKNAAYLEFDGSENLVTSNAVFSGTSTDYIDLLEGVDFITARVSEDVFSLLKKNKKLLFTKADLELVKSTIEGSLRKWGVEQKIILENIDVVVPNPADISGTDKAARILNDVTFAAVAGDWIVTGKQHQCFQV